MAASVYDFALYDAQILALKRDGIIELEGKRLVTVPDFEALMAETGDDADGGVFA